MAKAINTVGITLKCGESAEALTKLVDIKDFPDLGGAPEMLECTTLSDDMQSYILGIQALSALEFTANYTEENYDAVKAKANKELFYSLEFGEGGSKGGVFTWQGQHDVYLVGGSTNAVVDMKITVAPSTKITKAAKGE